MTGTLWHHFVADSRQKAGKEQQTDGYVYSASLE